MTLCRGAVSSPTCPLLQLFSLDPLDRVICDEVGWVPTVDLTEGFLSGKSVDDLLDYQVGVNHYCYNVFRSYHISNNVGSWTDFQQRSLFNHLRLDSLTHEAICARLLRDKLQPACCRLTP